jgi:hypothetical protein
MNLLMAPSGCVPFLGLLLYLAACNLLSSHQSLHLPGQTLDTLILLDDGDVLVVSPSKLSSMMQAWVGDLVMDAQLQALLTLL